MTSTCGLTSTVVSWLGPAIIPHAHGLCYETIRTLGDDARVWLFAVSVFSPSDGYRLYRRNPGDGAGVQEDVRWTSGGMVHF